MAVVDRRGNTPGPNADLAIKQSVRVATTGSNIALSGLQTIDVTALNAGDRVLVKDQSDATTNGIYVASTGNWTRAIDFATNTQVAPGTMVLVTAGASWAGNQLWYDGTDNPAIIGTSELTFAALVPRRPASAIS